MSARRLVIEAKVRPYPIALVGPDHFQCRDGEAVDPRLVIEEPGYSLYCLDPDRRAAIFVHTPPAADLLAAPFYCQAQYDAAQSLVAVGYDALPELAARTRMSADRLILVYSVGRCGSTLVSRAFSAAEDVCSLAEPDVFTQLIALRETGRCDPAELPGLLRDCTDLVCGMARGPAPVVAVKFRSFVLDLADIFYQHYPAARIVFLYRGALGWGRSTTRAFGPRTPQTMAQQTQTQDRLGSLLPLLAAQRRAKGRLLTSAEAMACHWVALMDAALALHRRGIPMFVARYEELASIPERVLGALFEYCGLPALDDAELARVIEADSQAGSSLSRAAVRSDAAHEPDVRDLTAAIAELSATLTADTLIPHTYPVDRRGPAAGGVALEVPRGSHGLPQTPALR